MATDRLLCAYTEENGNHMGNIFSCAGWELCSDGTDQKAINLSKKRNLDWLEHTPCGNISLWARDTPSNQRLTFHKVCPKKGDNEEYIAGTATGFLELPYVLMRAY
jgi:hypothetical protein